MVREKQENHDRPAILVKRASKCDSDDKKQLIRERSGSALSMRDDDRRRGGERGTSSTRRSESTGRLDRKRFTTTNRQDSYDRGREQHHRNEAKINKRTTSLPARSRRANSPHSQLRSETSRERAISRSSSQHRDRTAGERTRGSSVPSSSRRRNDSRNSIRNDNKIRLSSREAEKKRILRWSSDFKAKRERSCYHQREPLPSYSKMESTRRSSRGNSHSRSSEWLPTLPSSPTMTSKHEQKFDIPEKEPLLALPYSTTNEPLSLKNNASTKHRRLKSDTEKNKKALREANITLLSCQMTGFNIGTKQTSPNGDHQTKSFAKKNKSFDKVEACNALAIVDDERNTSTEGAHIKWKTPVKSMRSLVKFAESKKDNTLNPPLSSVHELKLDLLRRHSFNTLAIKSLEQQSSRGSSKNDFSRQYSNANSNEKQLVKQTSTSLMQSASSGTRSGISGSKRLDRCLSIMADPVRLERSCHSLFLDEDVSNDGAIVEYQASLPPDSIANVGNNAIVVKPSSDIVGKQYSDIIDVCDSDTVGLGSMVLDHNDGYFDNRAQKQICLSHQRQSNVNESIDMIHDTDTLGTMGIGSMANGSCLDELESQEKTYTSKQQTTFNESIDIMEKRADSIIDSQIIAKSVNKRVSSLGDSDSVATSVPSTKFDVSETALRAQVDHIQSPKGPKKEIVHQIDSESCSLFPDDFSKKNRDSSGKKVDDIMHKIIKCKQKSCDDTESQEKTYTSKQQTTFNESIDIMEQRADSIIDSQIIAKSVNKRVSSLGESDSMDTSVPSTNNKTALRAQVDHIQSPKGPKKEIVHQIDSESCSLFPDDFPQKNKESSGRKVDDIMHKIMKCKQKSSQCVLDTKSSLQQVTSSTRPKDKTTQKQRVQKSIPPPPPRIKKPHEKVSSPLPPKISPPICPIQVATINDRNTTPSNPSNFTTRTSPPLRSSLRRHASIGLSPEKKSITVPVRKVDPIDHIMSQLEHLEQPVPAKNNNLRRTATLDGHNQGLPSSLNRRNTTGATPEGHHSRSDLQSDKAEGIQYRDKKGGPGVYSGEVDQWGRPHGEGRIEYDNGQFFEGRWINGEPIQEPPPYQHEPSYAQGHPVLMNYHNPGEPQMYGMMPQTPYNPGNFNTSMNSFNNSMNFNPMMDPYCRRM